MERVALSHSATIRMSPLPSASIVLLSSGATPYGPGRGLLAEDLQATFSSQRPELQVHRCQSYRNHSR